MTRLARESAVSYSSNLPVFSSVATGCCCRLDALCASWTGDGGNSLSGRIAANWPPGIPHRRFKRCQPPVPGQSGRPGRGQGGARSPVLPDLRHGRASGTQRLSHLSHQELHAELISISTVEARADGFEAAVWSRLRASAGYGRGERSGGCKSHPADRVAVDDSAGAQKGSVRPSARRARPPIPCRLECPACWGPARCEFRSRPSTPRQPKPRRPRP